MTTPLRTLKQACDARQDDEILKQGEIAELISTFAVTASKPDIENAAEGIAQAMTEYGVTTIGDLRSLNSRTIGRMGATGLQATRLRGFLGVFLTEDTDESDEEVRIMQRSQIAKVASQGAMQGQNPTATVGTAQEDQVSDDSSSEQVEVAIAPPEDESSKVHDSIGAAGRKSAFQPVLQGGKAIPAAGKTGTDLGEVHEDGRSSSQTISATDSAMLSVAESMQ